MCCHAMAPESAPNSNVELTPNHFLPFYTSYKFYSYINISYINYLLNNIIIEKKGQNIRLTAVVFYCRYARYFYLSRLILGSYLGSFVQMAQYVLLQNNC